MENEYSEKGRKIEQVVFRLRFVQVVDMEWVTKWLCVTKGPVRTGADEGRKRASEKIEQVTLTLQPHSLGKTEP